MGGEKRGPKRTLEFLRALNRSDLGTLAEVVLRHAISLVPGAQAGSFMVLNEAERAFEFRAAVGLGMDMDRLARFRFPQDQVPQKTLFHDEPAIIRYPYELNRGYVSAELAELLESRGNKAILTFPIAYEGKVIAYLNLESQDPDAFTPADFARLEGVAEEIALAVHLELQRAKLQESEERYRALAENVPDVLLVMDLEGNITYMSKTVEEGTGYTREEIEGQNIRALLTPESYAVALERIRKWKEGVRGLPRYVVEVRTKDDRIVPFELNTSPIIRGGELVGVQIIARDISERAQVERELRESEARSRLLFERLADAVYITTFEGEILEANPAASLQTGYSHQELVGKNIMRDLPAEEPVVTYETANQMLARGETVYFEEKKRRKDGTVFWTECAVTPIEYRGTPATLSVNRDITDRKRLEEELRELYQASVTLGSRLELDELLKLIYERAAALIPFDAFSIAVVDARKSELRFEVTVEEGEFLPKRVRPLERTASLAAWVVYAMEPLLIRDFEREKGTLPAAVHQVGKPIRSWLGVPLVFQGQAIGVMTVQSFQPYAFGGREMRLLTAFAGGAAAAIADASLHADLTRLAGKLRAVEAASRRMKLARSKDELYEIVLDSIHQILGYQACAILEPRGEALEVVIERGYSPEARSLKIPLSGEKGVTAAAFASDEPVYVLNVAKDPRYLPRIPGAKCELAIPISSGERKFGVLNVEHDQVDGIPPDDQVLLGIIASELAVTLVSLERLTGVQSLGEKLTGLHHAVQQLQRCTTEEEVLQTAVQVAQDILRFEICSIDFVEGDLLVPKAASGIALELTRPYRKGDGLAGKTWKEGRTFWGNLRDFPEARPVHHSFQSFISVPIGDFGVFQVAATEPGAFDQGDVQLAEILAGHLREEIQRVRLERELRFQAIHDPLTGLFNRRHLPWVLEHEIERARRYGHSLALLLLDVDNFKAVNDRLGHPKGDEVLREIAALIQENVRESDLVFRYGGDEFLIVLTETDGRAMNVAARLQEATARFGEENELAGLGLSVGLAVWKPEEEKGAKELLREADEALYRAKRCP